LLETLESQVNELIKKGLTVLKQKKEKVRDQQERKLQPTQQQLATN
jgi:hypothetical protein